MIGEKITSEGATFQMDKLKLQEKKGMLDKLFYKENKQRDFYLCGTYVNKDGEKKFSKWKSYLNCVANIDVLNLEKNDWKDLEYFKQINQRQIFPHEIVLDMEEPEQLKPIVEKIRGWGWEGVVFETGSRGYHIHLTSKEDFTEEEKEAIVLKLGTDIQKCSEKNLIALENYPHWKTGKLKRQIEVLI